MKKVFNEKWLVLLALAMSVMSLIISICCVIYIVNHKFVAAYVKIDTPFSSAEKHIFADFSSDKEPNEPNSGEFWKDFWERREAKKIEEAKNELELKEATENRRRKYVEEHPELSDFVKGVILKGSYAEGMTKEQIIASLGEPDSVNKGDIYEQFIYGYQVIYFENGVCKGH